MRILIIGGCGFVGANLAYYFSERGHGVTVFDNLVRRGGETNLEPFKKSGITFIHGDIRNKEDFPKGSFDAILECSAQPSATDGYDNPYYDITNNTYGLINVLEYVRQTKTPMIFWSTNKVYCGDKINRMNMIEGATRYHGPNNEDTTISETFSIDGGDHSIYGLSKIMSDLACQEYAKGFNLPIVVNRFSCLAGPRQWGKCSQGWVAWWAIAAILGLPLKYIGWNGKQVRDVLFVPDICALVESELNNISSVSGMVFNAGGGFDNSLSLIEATNLVESMTGKKISVSLDPEPRKADHCVYISNILKAKSYLDWQPKVHLSEGYEQIIKWVVDNKSTLERMYL